MVNARFGEGTVKAAVQKTLADVFGMTPFVGVPTFFMWTSAMQGHTLPEFKERVRANYPTTAFGSIGATRPCLRYSCIQSLTPRASPHASPPADHLLLV
jgi:hypothetical protein